MTKAEFQAAHGERWNAIVHDPAFFAALNVCSANKLTIISMLTDEQIDSHGKTILAGYRDHLQLENALIDLAVADTGSVFDLPEETYADPNASPAAPEQSEDEPQPGGAFHKFQAAQPAEKPRKPKCPQKPSKRQSKRNKKTST